MKAKLIYITTFLITFIVITLLIVKMNSMYQNIFEFNFSEVKEHLTTLDSLKKSPSADIRVLAQALDDEFSGRWLDTLKAYQQVKRDTVYKEILKDGSLLDSIESLNAQITALQSRLKLSQENEAKLKSREAQQTENKKENEVSVEWAKTTAKLIETMSPQQAAKVIRNYSDNEAREVIYNLNKRKAAEILSQLDPNFINRITKLKP